MYGINSVCVCFDGCGFRADICSIYWRYQYCLHFSANVFPFPLLQCYCENKWKSVITIKWEQKQKQNHFAFNNGNKFQKNEMTKTVESFIEDGCKEIRYTYAMPNAMYAILQYVNMYSHANFISMPLTSLRLSILYLIIRFPYFNRFVSYVYSNSCRCIVKELKLCCSNI